MNFDKLTDDELLKTIKVLIENHYTVVSRLSDHQKHSPFEVTLLCNIKASYEADLRKLNEEIAKRQLKVSVVGECSDNEDTRF